MMNDSQLNCKECTNVSKCRRGTGAEGRERERERVSGLIGMMLNRVRAIRFLQRRDLSLDNL